MAKRLITALLMVVLFVCFISGQTTAEDTTGGVQWGGLNLNGDTLYLFSRGSFAVGVGTTIAAAMDGIVELRAEGAKVMDGGNDPNLIGVGVGVKVRPLVEMLGGTWVLEKLNTGIGVVGMFNLDGATDNVFEPAVYVTIIGLQF